MGTRLLCGGIAHWHLFNEITILPNSVIVNLRCREPAFHRFRNPLCWPAKGGSLAGIGNGYQMTREAVGDTSASRSLPMIDSMACCFVISTSVELVQSSYPAWTSVGKQSSWVLLFYWESRKIIPAFPCSPATTTNAVKGPDPRFRALCHTFSIGRNPVPSSNAC